MRASGDANAEIMRRIKEAKEYKRDRDSQVPQIKAIVIRVCCVAEAASYLIPRCLCTAWPF